MKDTIENLIKEALKSLGIEARKFVIEHPTDISHGDYSTNVGIVTKRGHEIKAFLEQHLPKGVEKIELESGFINFYLSKEFFADSLGEIIEKGESFGKNNRLKGKKVMVEYTDPNVMKPFHIGHLMSNTIGESLSRIIEWEGAGVIRANYYSDTGLNIAKAVWGMKEKTNELPEDSSNNSEKAKFLGSCYVLGVQQSTANPEIERETIEINKKIFDRSDNEINGLYDLGKKWSLEYFTELYTRLGSSFDWLVGESEVVSEGKELVLEFLKKGIFEESEGAIIFRGEKYGPKLHTRVFINKEGLPTYEAKEIGLTKRKFEEYKLDQSIVITGNEQNEYFKVVLEAMRQAIPEAAEITKHFSHGMLRLPTGKMSSRTGDVITAEVLIDQVKKVIEEKGNKATDDIAIGAIKYTILKQGIGNDIIFDFDKSISTEGDSGPYLQYTCARTNSLLEKAKNPSLSAQAGQPSPWQGREKLSPPDKGESEGVRTIERLLYRFPEIVERAGEEYAPQLITTYLIELSSAFNNFYAHEQVIPPSGLGRAGSDSPETPYRLAIVKAFNIIIKNGLSILGIPTPERI
ncbi:MAG: arginine--tRNA ligase [Patescibacteria group bacterium]